MVLLKKYIGSRAFYRKLFAILIPILIQNVITNFVSLLDNIMVGQVGTEPMSGVAIVNQLLFVFNLCIFGGLAGAGILTAQYYGSGDHRGVADTFRAKIYIAFAAAVAFLTIFSFGGETLIRQFIHEGSENLDMAATLLHARDYLHIMLFQIPPFAFQMVYASTLRETGETVLPMKAGITAVLVNLVLNYILIFGKFGAPVLGVEGAAIATVVARYIECTIIVVWTHRHRERNPFLYTAYTTFRIPGARRYRAADLEIEGDWSAAAAFLVAGAVFGSAQVQGLSSRSLQADLAICDILLDAGASVASSEEGDDICVCKGPLEGFEADLNNAPDLFPVVAVLAAFCEGETRLKGVRRLLGKECNRADAISEMLFKMGVPVSVEGDEMTIRGENYVSRILNGRLLKGGAFSSSHDHRMVMALKIASLGAAEPIVIDDRACVAKSFPEFFEMFD